MRSWSASLAVVLLVLSTIAVPTPARASIDTYIDDDTSRFEPFIEAASEQGLIDSCNPPKNDRVCPQDPMTAGTMVLTLARAVGLRPPVADRYVTRKGRLGDLAISALEAAGIPTGCDTTAACPDRPITRAEMAALFSRAFRWGDEVGYARYADITASPHRDALAQLAERGGLLPCDAPLDTKLCPNARVRRDEAMFAVVSTMGLGAASTRDDPAPKPLGFTDSFDSLALWDGRTPSYRNRVSLTNSGYSGSGLRVSIPRGSHFGADFHLHLDDTVAEEPDQLYFRYYLKLDADWETSSSGKLPGFSGVYGSTGKGGYPSSPVDPGWSARLKFSPAKDGDPRVALGYYVYHLGQETQYGDGVGWNEAGKLQPGEWYCLEGQVRMNTLGIADGSLEAWVDETPALDISGLEFRRPDEPEISIESFWFNVYYGGKEVPDHDLGMTVDEVAVDTHRIGCSAGPGMSRPLSGDFDGDGTADTATWETCPEGTCLVIETNSRNGLTTTREVRDSAWLSLESHRLGMTAGDVDGDGEDEIVYRGRCDDSSPCWRVHTDIVGGGANVGNWGDGARFSAATTTPLLADWDGDGLDDLAYQGLCGAERRSCWRVHNSNGTTFDEPADWGPAPEKGVTAMPADLDGDGRDDLLYQSGCKTGTCWFAQLSDGKTFTVAQRMGRVRKMEADHLQLIDFDGNGTTDLVTWTGGGDTSRIEIRYAGARGLSAPILLAELDRQIEDVLLMRPKVHSPVQAVITARCGESDLCTEYLFAPSGEELADPSRYRNVIHSKLGLPPIV